MQDFWVWLKVDSISWLKTMENNFMKRLVVNTLFQEMTVRFISGKLKNIFRVNFHKFSIGLMIVGKHAWQQEEERKGDISTALMFQEYFPSSSRTCRTQSYCSFIVLIQRGFFLHIHHIGCAFSFHSIINNGLILGGQNSRKRQTVFF